MSDAKVTESSEQAAESSAAEKAPRAGADIGRREAIGVLSMVPLAAAFDWSGGPAVVERATRMVRGLPTAAETEAGAFAPKFFTAHEWRTVGILADYVIPRDERSGSATDAKVPEYMDFVLADPDASESAKLAMRGGLAWLDNECRTRFGHPFVDSADAQRRQVLDDIAWPRKARPEMSHGVAFFNRFRDMTASGFFSSQMGWKDLQYMGHVFVPEWNGCPPAALEKLGVSYDLMNSRMGIAK
jgi:hypothetical protein